MAAMSDALEVLLVNHLFRTDTWAKPTVLACALLTTDADDANFSDTSQGNFKIYHCNKTIISDLNSDCYFDLLDFAIFANGWLDCGNPYDSNCQ